MDSDSSAIFFSFVLLFRFKVHSGEEGMVSFLKFVRYTTIVGAALLVILAGWISRGAKLALTEEFQKKTVTHVAGERGTCRGNPLGSAEKAAINGFPYKCGWNFVSSDPSKQLEVFAYTMPPGILGWSNAALVVDHSRYVRSWQDKKGTSVLYSSSTASAHMFMFLSDVPQNSCL